MTTMSRIYPDGIDIVNKSSEADDDFQPVMEQPKRVRPSALQRKRNTAFNFSGGHHNTLAGVSRDEYYPDKIGTLLNFISENLPKLEELNSVTLDALDNLTRETIAVLPQGAMLTVVLTIHGWKNDAFDRSQSEIELNFSGLNQALGTLYLSHLARAQQQQQEKAFSEIVKDGENNDLLKDDILHNSFCPNILIYHLDDVLMKMHRHQQHHRGSNAGLMSNYNTDRRFSSTSSQNNSNNHSHQQVQLRASSTSFTGACILADISGFTKLSCKYCSEGSKGLDKLHNIINGYLGTFVQIVYSHKGDVISFAGDALICIFRTTLPNTARPDEMAKEFCERAVQCSFALKDHFTEQLSSHIGVSCGEINFASLGGFKGAWTYLMNGACISELSQCVDDASSKEVVVTSSVYNALISGNIVNVTATLLATQNYKINGLTLLPNRAPVHSRFVDLPKGEILMDYSKKFVPKPAVDAIASMTFQELSSLREVTTIFLKLDTYNPNLHRDPLKLQPFYYMAQQHISKTGGFMRQFLVDDKGCVLIIMWGVPTSVFPQNASRAVNCAMAIHNGTMTLNHRCSIGITTGNVYCGVIGSLVRRDFVGIGDKVNLAARLMGKSKGKIYLDEQTFSNLPHDFKTKLEKTESFKVKGVEEPLYAYICDNNLALSFLGITTKDEAKRSYLPKKAADKLNVQIEKLKASISQDRIQMMTQNTSTLSDLQQIMVPGINSNNVYFTIIEGVSGSGKSAAANYFRSQARKSGLKYHVINARAGDDATPFGVLRKLFTDLIGPKSFQDEEQQQTVLEGVLNQVKWENFVNINTRSGTSSTNSNKDMIAGKLPIAYQPCFEALLSCPFENKLYALAMALGLKDLLEHLKRCSEEINIGSQLSSGYNGSAYNNAMSTSQYYMSSNTTGINVVQSFDPYTFMTTNTAGNTFTFDITGSRIGNEGAGHNTFAGSMLDINMVNKTLLTSSKKMTAESSSSPSDNNANTNGQGFSLADNTISKSSSLEGNSSSTSGDKHGAKIIEALMVIALQVILKRHPNVVIIEDCHYCDESSWNVLHLMLYMPINACILITTRVVLGSQPGGGTTNSNNLTKQIKPTMSFFRRASGLIGGLFGGGMTKKDVVTYGAKSFHRSEAYQSITKHANCEHIEMKPLNFKEVRKLMNQSLHNKEIELPDELIDKIMKISSGNVFWCKEIANFIMERGVEAFQSAIDDNANGTKSKNPLEVLVVCRYEKLTMEQQVVLRHAALIGEEFTLELLIGILPQRLTNNMDSIMEALLNYSFVEVVPDESERFVFGNATIRQILCDLTPDRDANKIHKDIADYIVQKAIHHKEKMSNLYQVIGEHYAAAGDENKQLAFIYTTKAADEALSRGAKRDGYDLCLNAFHLAEARSHYRTIEKVVMQALSDLTNKNSNFNMSSMVKFLSRNSNISVNDEDRNLQHNYIDLANEIRAKLRNTRASTVSGMPNSPPPGMSTVTNSMPFATNVDANSSMYNGNNSISYSSMAVNNSNKPAGSASHDSGDGPKLLKNIKADQKFFLSYTDKALKNGSDEEEEQNEGEKDEDELEDNDVVPIDDANLFAVANQFHQQHVSHHHGHNELKQGKSVLRIVTDAFTTPSKAPTSSSSTSSTTAHVGTDNPNSSAYGSHSTNNPNSSRYISSNNGNSNNNSSLAKNTNRTNPAASPSSSHIPASKYQHSPTSNQSGGHSTLGIIDNTENVGCGVMTAPDGTSCAGDAAKSAQESNGNCVIM